MTDPLPWLVVCPQPQAELKAYRWLAYSGCQPYVPLERKSIQGNWRQRRDVTRPIFPGYVFVKMRSDIPFWDQVESAPVTMRLWRSDGRPIRLNDSHIEALRQIEHRINNPPPPAPLVSVKPGDTVEIVADSIWLKHLAVVASVDTRARISLLLNLFGRLTRLQVSASQVRLVAQPASLVGARH